MKLSVITLAAGKGSRMKSDLPKVLHPLAGIPMLAHVLKSAGQLENPTQHVVIGHGADKVKQAINLPNLKWAMQTEQKGTGHAVAQAMGEVAEDAQVLVLYGDVPLIKRETLENLIKVSPEGLALLTIKLDNPTGYGRIVRDLQNNICSIVEEKDANEEQLKINEVNTGILCVEAKYLKRWLPQLSANNAQGEYYLTDIIAMAVSDKVEVKAIHPEFEHEVQGVNDRLQLAQLERVYQRSQADDLMRQGVLLADPSRFDVRGSLTVGKDVKVDVGCIFEGEVELGDGVNIGAYCHIKDATIGKHTKIASHSVIEQSTTAENCTIGPFTRLRPGANLGAQAKVGNFCEIKKAQIGKGAKVNHLSYIGDAEIGENANIGAGSITCNYDGVNKFKTIIGDDAFVGTNSSLVAPVEIGKGATIGAGSVITKAVADDELAIARGKQRNISSWARPEKK